MQIHQLSLKGSDLALRGFIRLLLHTSMRFGLSRSRFSFTRHTRKLILADHGAVKARSCCFGLGFGLYASLLGGDPSERGDREGLFHTRATSRERFYFGGPFFRLAGTRTRCSHLRLRLSCL